MPRSCWATRWAAFRLIGPHSCQSDQVRQPRATPVLLQEIRQPIACCMLAGGCAHPRPDHPAARALGARLVPEPRRGHLHHPQQGHRGAGGDHAGGSGAASAQWVRWAWSSTRVQLAGSLCHSVNIKPCTCLAPSKYVEPISSGPQVGNWDTGVSAEDRQRIYEGALALMPSLVGVGCEIVCVEQRHAAPPFPAWCGRDMMTGGERVWDTASGLGPACCGTGR